MATASFAPNDLLVSDVDVITRTITLAAGQNQPRGAVLGRVTASDKYVLSASAAVDGSEAPAVILAYDVDATAADVECQAYTAAAVDGSKLTLGAGHTADTVEAAFRQANSALYVRTLA